MDVTNLFKACVKTVRTRNKSLNSLLANNTNDDKNRILKSKRKDEFITKSKSLMTQISKLRDFLQQNKKAYLNFSNIKDDFHGMTDQERDQIETGAQQIIDTCLNIILDLRKENKTLNVSQQYLEHRKNVIELVDSYLKVVCKLYIDIKSLRMRKALEIQKMSKLEHKFNDPDPYKIQKLSPPNKNISELNITDFEKQSPKKVITTFDTPTPEEVQLSPEELQMFEEENEQLYSDLNSLDEEVKQIESKVVHISELQQIFTEKVLEQEKDIERITTSVVGATENLRDANDQIRQAIQRNAGLRVWVLFFLLVMSFSLLFLDWYND